MKNKPHRCRQCGLHEDDIGRVSRRGLCPMCQKFNQEMNTEQLTMRAGPAFNLWKQRTEAGVAEYQAAVMQAIANRMAYEQDRRAD